MENRRRFRRVEAPVLCRPRSAIGAWKAREVRDISMGGLRVYSDEPQKEGSHVEIELLLRDGESLVFDAEVVWVRPLEGGGPAQYDVGLRLLELQQGSVERLSEVLGPAEE